MSDSGDSEDGSSVYSELEREAELESDIESDEGDGENDQDNDEPDQFDSSDEEDLRNTIGNIPVQWYDEATHIGYNLDGKQIGKPAKKGEIDAFLERSTNPDFWRMVRDKQLGKDVALTDEQITKISSIKAGKYPEIGYNPYQPFIDFFTYEVMKTPVTARPDHKRSFIPSKIERAKVGRIVHAIKMGWMQPRKPKALEDEQPKYYNLWEAEDSDAKSKSQLHRLRMHIPAPKMKLPGHAESYNPPAEYLFTEDELKKWEEQEPYERKYEFVPQKNNSLRETPAYPQFIKERFERCLDLYMAPRMRKERLNIDPNELLPNLPKPQDLQPFPTTQAIVYKGHSSIVRCVCVEPKGQFMASGSDDHSVKIWEIATGRCLKTIKLSGPIRSLTWCPNVSIVLLAVAVSDSVHLINPGVGDKLLVSDTDSVLKAMQKTVESTEAPTTTNSSVVWSAADAKSQADGVRVSLNHTKPVKSVVWHAKGDYFASLLDDSEKTSVVVHQLSKWKSQCPFSKTKGTVQKVLFHPSRPLFFVATQRFIRVYNLAKQELSKKLTANCQFISSLALHPSGDHLIVGSFDSRVSWFDMDLSTKPYKTLKHHRGAVRSVCFHPHYPLFASCSDDGGVIVYHGMVYSDLMQNPLIVPVKILRGHQRGSGEELNVADCHFHPTQPWIFTSGADATVRLFV